MSVRTNNTVDVHSDISPSGTERIIQGTVLFHGKKEIRDGDVDRWVIKQRTGEISARLQAEVANINEP